MDESGYAVRWLLRVALAQFPALPERTWPLIRDTFGASGEAFS